MFLLYVSTPYFMPFEISKRLDGIAIGLAGFAILPFLLRLLAYFFEEVSIAGIGAKLRDDDAASKNRELTEDITMGTIFDEVSLQPPCEESMVKPLKELEKLANEYVSTRGSMSPGSERTGKMTKIFNQMENVARKLELNQINVCDWLSNEKPGRQLAAIAWLRSHPKDIKPKGLIEVVFKSKQSFIQYWALRALKKHLDESNDKNFLYADRRKLNALEALIGQGTDRYYQLRRINKKLGQ